MFDIKNCNDDLRLKAIYIYIIAILGGMTLVRSNVLLFTRHHFSSNVIEGVVRIGEGTMGDRHP